MNGQASTGVKPGGFHRLDRTWNAGDRVVLTLPMQVRASRWYNDSVALERGPLVYSLKIGEDWRKLTAGMKNPARAPSADWEVHPTTPWNYGLSLDLATLATAVRVREKPIGAAPFSPDGAPVELTVNGRRLPQWTMVEGSADAPPKNASSSEPIERLTLIPYGSAKLRVTAFPLVP